MLVPEIKKTVLKFFMFKLGLLAKMTQKLFWSSKSYKINPRWKQLKLWRNTSPWLIADICKKWSLAPSISVRSQYFIFPHFSERGKYDSLIDCCINVLPSDERWGVLCFYVIRLTPSWDRALCNALALLRCQGPCDGHLEQLVLLYVLFVLRYHPRHFINQRDYFPVK